jgi:heme a synthase
MRSEVSAAPERGLRSLAPVRTWLWVLAALVVAMVVIGGVTRLTGSGLSITEWKPVTGAIPPLSESAWLAEFEKYRASPQYRLLNQGMSLDEFRFIYWWEWGHRQLGRFLGLAFFVPLFWFWARGYLTRGLALALVATGALGGLQAAVGWIMVASGLKPGMTAVAPIKLTLHLLIASAILALLLWLATGLRERLPSSARLAGARRDLPRAGRAGARILLGLIFIQIALGGLVAGSKAGLAYNTWPLMDGQLVPPVAGLFAVSPWIENFVDNVTLVQFNHRMAAYLVVGFALWHAFLVRTGDPATARRAALVAVLALAQMALGIATLLLAVPLWAGLAHQLLAVALLGTAVIHARLFAHPAPLSSH